MKNLFYVLIAISFGSISQAAKPIKLTMDLTLNGKVSHPIVITNFGKKAIVSMIEKTGNGYQVSILPSETIAEGRPAVKLDMEVFDVKNKVATRVSNPKVITVIGETAKLAQSGRDSMVLSITPTQE